MSDAIITCHAMQCDGALAPPSLATRWAEVRSVLMRWLAHQRLGDSIAHLDDRLLADAGFRPQDLGLGERLIRRFVAGGHIWAGDKTD